MQPKAVHLFVFDTLADWEPGYVIAGLNNPAFQIFKRHLCRGGA